MKIEKMIAELAYLLEVEASQLTGDTVLEHFENWDSLAAVSMIAMIDQHTGITMDAEELYGCQTINAMIQLAFNKKQSAA